MTRIFSGISLAVVGMVTLALGAPAVHAQGKIVCWKDAAGKVVGCGDKVPAEYATSGTKELDKQGNVRKTGESAEEATKRQAAEKEQAAANADEKRRVTEQKRQDTALLNTFSSEKEIDLKRNRELQALDNFIVQQNAAIKGAAERFEDAKKRVADLEKDKKPVPPAAKEDLARAEREFKRITNDIASNEKAKKETITTYAAYRKRYAELRGVPMGPEAPLPPPPAPVVAAKLAPAPVAPPAAPAKK